MLLNCLYPGRPVSLRRGRFTFIGRVRHVTPRGNVTLRLTVRDGRPIAPLVLSVPPDRVDDAPAVTQGVEQTELGL